jgi:hypothetical protein
MFDGIDDFVSLPVSDLAHRTSGTLSFWFRIEGSFASPRFDRLFGASDNSSDSSGNRNIRNIQLFGDNLRVAFRNEGTRIVEGNVVGFVPSAEVGAWHHFAYTSSNDRGNAVFIDGVQRVVAYENGNAAQPAFLDVGTDISVAQFGAQLNDGSPVSIFQGRLDEVQVTSSALTPAQIGAIVAAGTQGMCKDLAAAGEVPSAGVSGTPLTVSKGPGDQLTLSWGLSCSLEDTDFEVYEGRIGDFYSHAAKTCTTGGITGAAVDPGPGNTYYLVVPRNNLREGSYGHQADGLERPPGESTCLVQLVSGCAQ